MAEAIKAQTSKDLEKKFFDVPEASEPGTYDVIFKPHAEVRCSFKIVVQA